MIRRQNRFFNFQLKIVEIVRAVDGTKPLRLAFNCLDSKSAKYFLRGSMNEFRSF